MASAPICGDSSFKFCVLFSGQDGPNTPMQCSTYFPLWSKTASVFPAHFRGDFSAPFYQLRLCPRQWKIFPISYVSLTP